VDLARLTLERDWHVRFIELMPLGGGECSRISIKRYVSNIETRRRIEAELGALVEVQSRNPSDEAVNYRLAGARGIVGFISPVSEPYCGTCNRMRLTADGKFHLCLLNDDELDVRKALRSGASMAQIGEILVRAVTLKPTGHHLLMGRSKHRYIRRLLFAQSGDVFELLGQAPCGFPGVVAGLQGKPQVGAVAAQLAEPRRYVGGDGGFAGHHAV
jgi:molybdenum cofactor biosynthesis enzyme MoaA